ncbi:hypothetical protein M1555_00850 [Patescibacteria group bacterium]|nr:hypothetical protein [Patescibacteria group bacterium]
MVGTIIGQAIAGATGGFVRGLVGITKAKEFDPKTFQFSWKQFGFTILVSMLVGLMSGLIMNVDWRMSLLAGYAGSDLLESLYKLRFASLIKSP